MDLLSAYPSTRNSDCWESILRCFSPGYFTFLKLTMLLRHCGTPCSICRNVTSIGGPLKKCRIFQLNIRLAQIIARHTIGQGQKKLRIFPVFITIRVESGSEQNSLSASMLRKNVQNCRKYLNPVLSSSLFCFKICPAIILSLHINNSTKDWD